MIRFSAWDGWELVEEYSSSLNVVTGYLQGATGVIKSWSAANTLYYYQDKLGSTTHVANASGQLMESFHYDLYGTPAETSTHGVVDLYAGERWISELRLYDLRNRFVSPELGRFLQPDPIGFKGDASNLYRYCGNDPADHTDPLGLLTWKYDKDYPADGPGGRKAVERAIKNELQKTAKGREILKGDGTVKIHVVKLNEPNSRFGKTHTEYSKSDSVIDTWFNPKSSLLLDPKSLSALVKHHEAPEDNDRGRAVIIGHEFSHGVFKEPDEHDGGRNIRDNENAIRRQLTPPMPSRHSDGGSQFPTQ